MDAQRSRDFSILIGDRGGAYYQRVFERIEKGHLLNLNFAAGIFGPVWMLYRKMFVGLVLVYIPLVVLWTLVLQSYYNTHKDFSEHWWLVLFVPQLALFFIGNNIYYLRCRRIMLQQDRAEGDFGSGQRMPALIWRGGTLAPLPLFVYSLCILAVQAVYILGFVQSPHYFDVMKALFQGLYESIYGLLNIL